MKKINSNQVGIRFIHCAAPVTIDKRGSWGDDPDNFQKGPKGAFLKMKDALSVSHLVQPKPDNSAPIGWMPGSVSGLFNKLPIWVDDEKVIQTGESITINTADGRIKYTAEKPSMVTYNDLCGQPDPDDAWVQKISDIEANYDFKQIS